MMTHMDLLNMNDPAAEENDMGPVHGECALAD